MSLLLTFVAGGLVSAPSKAVPVAPPKQPAVRHVAYASFKRNGRIYHEVKANMQSGMVDARTVYTDGLISPWQLIQRTYPTAAITGTFFAPGIGTPVADVLVDGELLARGNRGSGVAFGADGSIQIFDKPFRREFDWGEYKWGLRGGVRLMTNGVVHPNPKAQKFRDPRIWGRAARTGIGLTKHGKLVFIATKHSVTLSEFGKAMKMRGVTDAVSLDGGGSTLLYYRGAMVVPTSRRLSNLVVLTERQDTRITGTQSDDAR